MAFSGTVSETNFTTRRVVENSLRRCRLPAEQATPEIVDIANDQLYLLLSDLANQGAPLWCIDKVIMPLYAGQGDVTLDTKVVDILNSTFRYLQEVTGTTTETSTTYSVQFSGDTFVTSVGILWDAASVPIALERSDDGATWTTIQSETPSATSGEWTWYDLEASVASAYFRVRATSGTLDYETVYLGNTPTEITLARMNRDDYTNLPNKFFQSNRPYQYWFDRQIPNPIMHMWPVPNAAAEVNQLVLWVHRYIMDVGTLTQTLEVPQRWFRAIVAMLAAQLARELFQVDPGIIPMLDADAAQALALAQAEERDNSPMMIAPNIAMYTR
jgi:hypothetical protein